MHIITAEEILKIDTVRAYHFGLRFLVECHIVLPEEMPSANGT